MIDPRVFAGPNIGQLFLDARAQRQQQDQNQQVMKLRLGELMTRQQEAEAKARQEAQERAATGLSRLAVGLKAMPYEQRRAHLQQLGPTLSQFGITADQVAGFDPTDANLDAYVALGGTAKDQQPTSLQRDYEFLQGVDPTLAQQFLRNRAEGSPIVANNGDGTFQIIPRSMVGGGAAAPGGNLDDTPTVEDGYRYTPGPGGRANQQNWQRVGGGGATGVTSNFPSGI